MTYPANVRIVEVGPRDGLQNEKNPPSTAQKVELINRLTNAGCQTIEAGSFVSPRWVPAMADSEQVMLQIERKRGVSYPVLVPNLKGLEGALAVKADEIAIFASASEAFSQKNLNCSIDESFERFLPVIEAAKAQDIKIRGYVSCVLGCPWQGDVPLAAVRDVSRRLYEAGCYEVSLGDTIGIGTPLKAQKMVEAVLNEIAVDHIALHFHDTYGQALANILACLDLGVNVLDSSVAGLGGCPYAKGATGNVASEDLVYMLHGMGIETGIDLDALVETGVFISEIIGKKPSSHLGSLAWARKTASE
ncbi:hydroxymethylglutaryl-CoA lyase [Bartonella sp. HY329]|uniref:hydroxymethylglutaryl-CoA lyase n=1 Tax=unclassified Bartonella TaxID=2645622 RepID=UPI0021C61CEA|nr:MULTISPECIES: hydroxymethylglutaryl-CoA lyase [unclassified Bartonella]UXM94649.1 hydroxymethylglutaryl-CoA lyase [Bartonella sp. HY329]UXN08972.1 hydroxymethylglutaryl-CoA lyase [Bartonella sp. HY328]